MSSNDRRKFLKNLGLTVGALAVGTDIALGFPPFQQKKKTFTKAPSGPVDLPVDFRYSPASWQSTYCFPDDPHKSLVGKFGELLYGHKGVATPYNEFAHTVSFGFRDKAIGAFVSQKLEAPGIPIITTLLEWKECQVEMVSFATNSVEEGRVDNLIVKIISRAKEKTTLTPEIVITSRAEFSTDHEDDSLLPRKEIGIVTLEDKQDHVFMIVDSPIDHSERDGVHRFRLQEESLGEGTIVQFTLRFPQAGQKFELLKNRMTTSDALIAEARSFWQSWKPFNGKADWNLSGAYKDFLVASARNMGQSREPKEGKGPYQVGPTVYRGVWAVDGHFMAEAARYVGNDKEAHDTIASLWDRQNEQGIIVTSAGEAHWKDTAVAVYALIRQAELTQNWDYFNELYPDAYKAMIALRDLRNSALNNGTSNGTYALLPRGFGDSGIGGIRSEFTNTLWTMVTLRLLLEVGDRFFLEKRSDLRDFYGQLRAAFIVAARQEKRHHPNGFSYLPMLMKEDAQWQDAEPRKQPRPQAAQIYLSHAFYPGLLFPKDDNLVKEHMELMKAVTKEEVPIESGWLPDRGVWTYNAAVTAQTYLWAGFPELARSTFIGFLNHASPLFAWREEQPLQGTDLKEYVGDMPHNWASAECIRYLRHMLVMEDDKILRLMDGIGEADLTPGKPIAITSTPTRWGRVSLSIEPLDAKAWVTKFKREDFDEKTMPPLTSIEMPRKLPGNFQLDKITGTTVIKNGPRAIVDGSALSWEIVWRNFSRT